MKPNKNIFIKVLLFIAYYSFCINGYSQSFNDEKTSMINYVKRMYTSSPFEGAKFIEGNETSYYVAAIILPINNTTLETNNVIAEKKAQEAGKTTFAEPCIKFEMLNSDISSDKKTVTYLFSFQPLSTFIKLAYKKQPFEGAKIIAAPKSNYFVSVVSLDPKKYTSESLMDRVALIKAKQQANTLFNGSTISSDIIIQTEVLTGNTVSTESIREQSMGFVEGLETLLKYIENDKKVYIFYRELSKN
jgi:hypothetical protein